MTVSKEIPPSTPEEFIVAYIRAHGGDRQEVLARKLIAAGEAAGYNERQLTNARRRATPRIGTRRASPRYDDPGEQGHWLWCLLEPPPQEEPMEDPIEPLAPVCDCGQPLWAPQSQQRGRCEACDRAAQGMSA